MTLSTFMQRAALALCLAAPTVAHGQSNLELNGLLEALIRPEPTGTITRSLGAAPVPAGPTAEEVQFLEALPTRGLTIEVRAEVAEIAMERELPRIDLDIPFDYDSDALRADVMADLVTIGRALSSEDLAGSRFILAGHTDGTGSAAYNQDLSERRAASVRAFLIEAFGLPPQQLVAVGFGFEQLRDIHNPAADVNRRVEVINLEVGWN
ncbi:OmpA family protein [Gymnodinialimonas sp.]